MHGEPIFSDQGNCWLHLQDPLKPTRSIQSNLLRRTILPHRVRASLLLRSHICHPEHFHFRQRLPICSHLAVPYPCYLYYDVVATVVQIIGAAPIGVEPKRPCHSEQYLASWVSPLGLLFLDLPHLTEFLPMLGAESTAQEHEPGVHRSVCSGDIVNISACMFRTSGDGRRTS